MMPFSELLMMICERWSILFSDLIFYRVGVRRLPFLNCGWIKSILQYKSINIIQIININKTHKCIYVCMYVCWKLTNIEWDCPDCNTKHDINASINIKKFALDKQTLIGIWHLRNEGMSLWTCEQWFKEWNRKPPYL